MDRNDLARQFSDCADLGTILPETGGSSPERRAAIAYDWLQDKTNAQFVTVFEMIASKAYGLDPAPLITGGNPYRHYVFMQIEAKTDEGDGRFQDFIVDIAQRRARRDILMGQSEGEDGRPAIIIQYNPHDMLKLTLELMQDRGLSQDDGIRPHINALHHLLGRTGENGFVPANRLH